MLLELVRDVFTAGWTLGVLRFNGLEFGYTCEDRDRGLAQYQDIAEIAAVKVRGETAIPTGHYRVRRTWSPRYQRDMLQVLDVPGFRGIRIHPGNGPADTEGCLLPGLRRDVAAGKVYRSTPAWRWLDEQVRMAAVADDDVWMTISRDAAAWSAYRSRT